MVYKPTKFNDSVNIPNPNHKAEFLKLIFIIFIIVLIIYFIFNLVSNIVISRISVETENKIFSKISYINNSKYLSQEDFRVVKVNDLFDKIPRKLLPKGYDFKLLIMQDKNINAFAMPGGAIILTTSLIDSVRNDKELIFVIGHELGHFVNRDHLKSLSGAFAAKIATALVFGSNSMLPNISKGFLELIDNKYSRTQELKADAWGLKVLIAQYGSVKGAIEFFETISKHNKEFPLQDFLATHPISETRIQNVKNLIEN